jgi:pimeloyl-ACP methyl ester carboxylesterase
MPYVDFGASRLYHEIHGDGDGPPVVLLHGVGGNHASWYQQFAGWHTRFRMIATDARGFGNSTDAEGRGRDGFVDDLRAVLDHLQLDRVRIVSQSMGGGTAMAFACRYPERVEAVVFADTMVGFELPAAIQPKMEDLGRRNMDLTQLQRVLGPTFAAREPAMSKLYLALASFNRYNIRNLPGVQQRYSTATLSQTGVPSLFVAGNEDVLFPPEAIRAVQSQVKGSRYVELEPAGHSAYFEQPEAFNRIVGDWLDKPAAR